MSVGDVSTFKYTKYTLNSVVYMLVFNESFTVVLTGIVKVCSLYFI